MRARRWLAGVRHATVYRRQYAFLTSIDVSLNITRACGRIENAMHSPMPAMNDLQVNNFCALSAFGAAHALCALSSKIMRFAQQIGSWSRNVQSRVLSCGLFWMLEAFSPIRWPAGGGVYKLCASERVCGTAQR